MNAHTCDMNFFFDGSDSPEVCAPLRQSGDTTKLGDPPRVICVLPIPNMAVVAFILPVVFCMSIQSRAETGAVPLLSCRNLKYLSILCFGTFSLVLGTNQIVARFVS